MADPNQSQFNDTKNNQVVLTEEEKKVVACLQGDMPITSRPYKEMAGRVGLEEETFVSIMTSLRDRGLIRRFGATLRHQMSGFRANAMVAWKVPADQVEEAGRVFASFDGVSHCYYRPPKEDWDYSLYTMIHGKSMDELLEMAAMMAEKTGHTDYSLLQSKRELKKTSMEYFPTDDDD